MFSNKALNLLVKCGWSEGRSIDITSYITSLEEEGFPIYEGVRDFLRRFGGLCIEYDNAYGAPIDLNLTLEDLDFWPENIKSYSDYAGIPFCPIGHHDTPFNVLLMAPDGRVFIHFQNGLSYVAPTGEEAIEALLTNQDFPLL